MMSNKFEQIFESDEENLVSLSKQYVVGKLTSKEEMHAELERQGYYVDFEPYLLRKRWIYNWQKGHMFVNNKSILIFSSFN